MDDRIIREILIMEDPSTTIFKSILSRQRNNKRISFFYKEQKIN
jgi:hypothetical protein